MGRSWRQFFKTGLTVGALAAQSAASTGTKIDAARLQGVQIKKVKYAVSWTGKTSTEGPIVVGLSKDISNTELAEFHTADPQRRNDPDESEQAERAVYPIGVLHEQASAIGPEETSIEFTQLRQLVDFPRWMVYEGSTISVYAFNEDSNTLTAGMIINFWSWFSGEWLSD